jgi:transposase-like protein
MKTCPYCQADSKQNRAGQTPSGSQRYECQHCGRKYTPEPKAQGYAKTVRQQAVQLYIDGMNFRRIGRHLGVNHQSVANWVNAYIANLPSQPPQPQEVTTIELDEVFTFIGSKKNEPSS